MHKHFLPYFTLFFLSLLLSGCFKKDSTLAPMKHTFYFEKQGFEVSFYIPERHCLYGQLLDSSGQKRKAEFNVETKSLRLTTYIEPTQNYSVSQLNDAVYIGVQTDLGVDIYNMLDSTLYKSHTFSYNFDSCILTNNKIYTISKNIGVCTLRVHDLETSNIIASKKLFSSTNSFVVSPDGSKIFSEGVAGNVRSIQITQLKNNTLTIIATLSQSISLESKKYKMTTNGSHILFSQGHLYDSMLNFVRTFSSCDQENPQRIFIKQDASYVGFACKNVSKLYSTSSNFFEIKSEDPQIYSPILDRELYYNSSFFFEYNGEIYRAINYNLNEYNTNFPYFVIVKI